MATYSTPPQSPDEIHIAATYLFRRPAPGSAATGFAPNEPQPPETAAVLLPASPKSPGEARKWTTAFLARCPGISQDLLTELAVVLVSELVTNAVMAVAPAACIELSLCLFEDRLLIAVADSSFAPPVLENAGPEAEHGRGLALVAGLSADWGWFFNRGRKVVFASVIVPSAGATG